MEYQRSITRDPDLPLVFHAYRGLEDLLLNELPHRIIREALVGAPYARHRYDEDVVDGWTPEEFQTKEREFLRQHKGYQPLHEWVLDQVTLEDMPGTFKAIVEMTADQRQLKLPADDN